MFSGKIHITVKTENVLHLRFEQKLEKHNSLIKNFFKQNSIIYFTS